MAWVLLPAGLGAAPPARFTRLSVEQGLSQSTVQAILQDHVGFLWFGTEEGLNRFDGYSFVVFKHDPRDPQSLPDDIVSALLEDRHRRLWVGTQRGLALFDRRSETFAPVPIVRERVHAILEDPDGTLWVGTEGEGLFERNPATGAFVLHQHDDEDPASLGAWVVAALLRDRRGRLWVGTRGAGLDRLEEGGKRFVHYRHDPRDPRSLASDDVWGLAEDTAGNLWVSHYSGGLSVLDHETASFRHYRHDPRDPGSLGADLVTSVFVDRSGTLWIGTDGAGVQLYDAASGRFAALVHEPADPTSLSHNVVRTIYEDVQGQIWVGTYLGGANLLKRPRRAFGYFTHSTTDPSSLADPAVSSFLEDTEGRIWVGTERGWLHRFDRERGTFVRYRFPSAEAGGSAVLSLHQDRRGRIWVGTYRGGLGRFDPVRGTFIVYKHRPGDASSVSGYDVWAIAEDEEGALWLGTNNGIDLFDPDRGVVSQHHDTPSREGLGTTEVRSMLRDRLGNLWVGTVDGLKLRLRGGGGFVHYRHDERDPGSLSNDYVNALHEDRQGRLWVGTQGGGIGRLDAAKGTFTSYRSFPSNVVHGIQEDAEGRLWLGTNHGLSRLDPASGQVGSFDLSNGLQSLQFHLSASLKTRGGRLLFGSVDGFYDFDPEAVKPDTYAPPVVFTSFGIFDKPARLPAAISTADAITLSHRDKIFSLEFAALDYAFPRRNQYAYRLEGFSEDWIQHGHRREVTFTNLDPGRYVFRVKASNADGVWSDASSASIEVVVRPPFWGTWWFRALGGGALASALLAAHRVRVRKLTADLAERERVELALRQAQEKYRSIFENSAEGIFQTTREGRILTANPALVRMLGFESPEELIAETTDLARQYYVDAGDRDVFTRRLELHDRLQGFTTEMRRRDGRRIWVAVSARAVRDGTGVLLYYEGTAEDATDRVQAQEAESRLRGELLAAGAEWESTFDSIEDQVLILDASGRVMRLNQAARLATGRPYATILGRALVDLGPGQPWLEASDVAARAGETRAPAHSRARDEDRERTWNVTARPLRGPRGEERVSVVIREVADHAGDERRLRGA